MLSGIVIFLIYIFSYDFVLEKVIVFGYYYKLGYVFLFIDEIVVEMYWIV